LNETFDCTTSEGQMLPLFCILPSGAGDVDKELWGDAFIMYIQILSSAKLLRLSQKVGQGKAQI